MLSDAGVVVAGDNRLTRAAVMIALRLSEIGWSVRARADRTRELGRLGAPLLAFVSVVIARE